MFITAESLLIAISATIAAASESKSAWPLIIVGSILMVVWSNITRSRARFVQFVQKLILWSEDGHHIAQPLMTFKNYQNSESGECTVVFLDGSKVLFIPEKVWPPQKTPKWKFWRWGTRIQMEIILPVVYLVNWVIIIVYVAFKR
jgi:hypothetical protein